MTDKIKCLVFSIGFGLEEANLFGPLSEVFCRMAQMGHEFHVVCRESNSRGALDIYQYPSGGFVKLYRIKQEGSLGKASFAKKLSQLVPKIFSSNAIDVIYTHIIHYLADFGIFYSKLYKVPHVYWVCSHWPKEMRQKNPFVKRILSELNEKLIMDKVDHIFTCTEFCKKTDSEMFGLPLSKFRVIPNSVNIDRYASADGARQIIAEKYAIPTDTPLILYFSSLSDRKGAIDLMHAIPYIKQEYHEPFQVLFCGPGEHERCFMNEWLINNKYHDVAQLTGKINASHAPVFYNACDIFCVPARYEGFGRVYVEAMSCGKPVVSCNIGGIPEVVEDGKTGILIPPRNPKAIAEALIGLLKDKDLRYQLGEHGRIRSKNMYSLDVVANQLASELLSVLP